MSVTLEGLYMMSQVLFKTKASISVNSLNLVEKLLHDKYEALT